MFVAGTFVELASRTINSAESAEDGKPVRCSVYFAPVLDGAGTIPIMLDDREAELLNKGSWFTRFDIVG